MLHLTDCTEAYEGGSEAVPGIKPQYFKGEERVEAAHCYAGVACEGMADDV